MAKDDGGHERLLQESEANLARRVEYERKRRGWSQERLAALMAKAGVPVHQSAISKIERTTDRRAIAVDEALAFARVFEIPVLEMLQPVSAAMSAEVERLWKQLLADTDLARLAQIKADEARFGLGELLEQHPDADPVLKELVSGRFGKIDSGEVDAVLEMLTEHYRQHRTEQ